LHWLRIRRNVSRRSLPLLNFAPCVDGTLSFCEGLLDGPTPSLGATTGLPPDESMSAPENILRLTEDLAKPEAKDTETKLRILTMRGMIEIDYDAAEARSTWRPVESQVLDLHHYELATRVEGEQGIAAFLLGDTETAKRQVVRAWGLSKVEHDPAATVRYASVFGAGLVQIHRYKEALTPLDRRSSKFYSSRGGLPLDCDLRKDRCPRRTPSVR